MKNTINLFCAITICLTSFLNPLHAEEDLTEAEMDSLAMKFYSWEKGDDSQIDHQIAYSMNRTLESFSQNHEYTIMQDAYYPIYLEKILIIVKENVYCTIPTDILRYAHDIHNSYGCAVDIVSVNGETAPQVKSLIKTYSSNLDGVVLIGDIAYMNYYHPDSIIRGDTIWKAETFPCDLYYMDLDGAWVQQGGTSNLLLAHFNDVDGDVQPDIFIGRINTAGMGRNEIQELKYYFEKNHNYWTGKKALNKQRALTFTGKDWDDWWREFRGGISPLYGSNYYDAVYGSSLFTKANYCTYLQNSNYEFIQLACHSNVQFHNFQTTTDSIMSYPIIESLTKQQIGYNLFCCKACNWTKYYLSPCLGESYLYGKNDNSSALVVIGSSKTGGMLGLKKFYNPLGNGKCIGEAFKEWWINQWGNNHNNYAIHWAYGMTILGDPLVDFNFTNDCEDNLYLNDCEETTNNIYYAQNKIIVQNYSITQGHTVSLFAPTIQITGPFVCNLGSTFTAAPFDSCVCNTAREYQQVSANRQMGSRVIKSDLIYSIYPNPVKDILTIDVNEQLNIVALYNLRGQCVLRTNHAKINVSNLQEGVYILHVTTEKGKSLQSMIIRK